MPTVEKMILIQTANKARRKKNVEDPMYTRESLMSKILNKPVSGKSLERGMHDFANERRNVTLLVDQEMLSHGGKVTSKLLRDSTARVAKKSMKEKVATDGLSA